MNSLQRMISTFQGKPVDRLPVQPICMTFAARVAGVRYYDYVTDYRILVDAQLKTIDKFDIDVATLCSDPAREAADCGAEITWFPDQPPAHDPQNPLLKEKRDLLDLKQPDPFGGGRMHDRVKGVALLRERIGGEIPILGWIEGPMAEAADLRGINEIMLDLIDDPQFVIELFDFILEMELNFARAQINAGVDIVGIGDAAASLAGPKFYREMIYPYEQKMVDGIHSMGCPVRLHICGNTTDLLEDMGRLGVEMVDIDYLTDIHGIREKMGSDVAILGNIEPVRYLLHSTPDDIYAALSECHREVGSKYIVGPGCEVPPLSPYDNVRAMVDCAKSVRQ